MSFDCVINGSIRICTLLVKESDYEQMYSENLFACTEKDDVLDTCGYNIDLICFPGPLIISPFRPKTRGGNTTLSGYYLELKERVWIQYESNYKQDQYYNEVFLYLIVGYFQTNTPDRINLTVKVFLGCVLRTIVWENRQTYNFTYQDTYIEKIDIIESVLDITGTNFYNQSILVAVKIDNNIIVPNDIISVDFENIKLNFNYSDPFSSKLNVQDACCDYWSNKFQITYPPIPSSVNSIPKLKGCLLIIHGNRLSSSPSSNNNTISITVENTNELLLYYDIPHIKTYSQVNDEIHIIGSCLVQNQIYNFNISIESNSIKSNDINVDVKLYVKINEIPPVEGIVSCSFLIENLCGIINYEIEIGNQRYQSSFSYESPLIDKFGKGFGNSNETTIIISNQSITFSNESNNNNDKSISFQMNEEYNILCESYLNVCVLLSNKVIINTIPIFKNVSIPNLFDTNGGDIIIIGKYLNNNTNIIIECNNEVIEKECKLNNISTFNLIYKSPSINQTSIINLKQGGILTIIGNDFYYPIDKVTIVGNENGNGNGNGSYYNLNCNEPKYNNDTMITCFIQATNNTFNNIKNGEMIFINVSTNGKSGISKVFKYLTQSDDSHQYSDARNIFQNLLLSILIILIISLLFISNI
ncbi:hypothetical protein ACTFIY_005682 [Dictyostelium cf. discoideum]